jgi:hypothetical protein
MQPSWVAAQSVGLKTAAAAGNPGLWESLEIPGRVAKLVPVDERLAGEAGSGVHLLHGAKGWF